jgi:hypothetical protein
MKPMKFGIVLLALLLAAMAMVPLISAAECQKNDALANSNVEFINHGDSVNLFDEFGLQKPAEPAADVPFRSYAESREIADKILAALEGPNGSDSVIGVYDLGTFQIMLISQEDSILEAVYDGKTVETYSLAPQLLGEKKQSGTPEKVETDDAINGDYTLTTETITRLYSVTLQLPDDAPALSRPGMVLTTYIVKKSRTDVYRNGLVDIASLHTEGWFYINYGSSITSIGDYSTYWVTSLPFWQACQYSTQNLGVGSTSGQHKTHLKFGAPYIRNTMDMWVSCDAWLNTNDGGFTNSWSSGNSDACS